MSCILIGLCDLETISDHLSSWNINKIGGKPNWLTTKIEPVCLICKQSLVLVCQLYCPLDNSPFHRSLYIFACLNFTCWSDPKGWVVIRCQKITSNVTKYKNKSAFDEFEIDEMDWGEDGLEYYTKFKELEIQDLDNLNKEDTISEAISKDGVPENILLSNKLSCGLEFNSYYINVMTEEDASIHLHDDLKHEDELLKKYLNSEGLTLSMLENQEVSSKSESSETKYYNKFSTNFNKYQKAISKCTNQVIRYCYDGEKLLMNEKQPVVPPCACGAKRLFELQLMPAIFKCLHLSNSDVILDFVNIIIFTCSKNCWNNDEDSFKYEYMYLELDDTCLNNLTSI